MSHRMLKSMRVAVAGLAATLFVLVVGMGSAAAAVVRPTVTVTNDANHDGVFTNSETVPFNAVYPYTVTYQVTIDTTGTPIGAFVTSLTDSTTPNISSCNLIGTFIPPNSSASCTYSVTLPGSQSAPIVNVVTLGYNALGLDFVSGSSTVNFQSPPPCPTGTKVNFRWHYRANGSSGSWSGTKTAVCPSGLTLGPQAMEGDLKVAPGTTLEAGYDFTVPGNNSTFPVTVSNPQVVFTVRCVSGAAPSAATLTVSMPTQTFVVTDSSWLPSGNQSSALVYQGSVVVPDLCAGGLVRLDKGGTFTADVS